MIVLCSLEEPCADNKSSNEIERFTKGAHKSSNPAATEGRSVGALVGVRATMTAWRYNNRAGSAEDILHLEVF